MFLYGKQQNKVIGMEHVALIGKDSTTLHAQYVVKYHPGE